jgi:hypothetical protein
MYYYDERPIWEREAPSQLEFDHRGFKVRKSVGFQLYSIVPPGGKVMVRELEGDFSHVRILEEKIDTFLKNHEGKVEAAFIDPEPPKPKRGRPPKNTQTMEETITT